MDIIKRKKSSLSYGFMNLSNFKTERIPAWNVNVDGYFLRFRGEISAKIRSFEYEVENREIEHVRAEEYGRGGLDLVPIKRRSTQKRAVWPGH